MTNKELLILNCIFVYVFNIIDTLSLYSVVRYLLIFYFFFFFASGWSIYFFIYIHFFLLHGTFVLFRYTINLPLTMVVIVGVNLDGRRFDAHFYRLTRNE